MKNFKQFISESPPMLDDYADKLRDRSARATINYYLNQKHHKANKIYDTHTGEGYHLHSKDGHEYYNLVNGAPKEYSSISNKNIQEYASKLDGDSKEIHNFMYHHAKTYGKVVTDKLHSKGAKQLWTNLADKLKPEYEIYHIHNNEEHKVTPDYLKSNETVIWNRNLASKKHKLELRHKK